VTPERFEWLKDYYRVLLEPGSDKNWANIETAARRAKIRAFESVATFVRKPAAWKVGARAGYALGLLPKASGLMEIMLADAVRNTLREQISGVLFIGERHEVKQFLQGMTWGHTKSCKDKPTRSGVSERDNYSPLVDRIISKHFDRLKKFKTDRERANFIKRKLPKKVTANRDDTWLDSFYEQVRIRWRRIIEPLKVAR